MGNQPSSSTGQTPVSARYQSSTLPDSFFSARSTAETPPPYDRHSSVNYADISDKAKVVFRSSDQEYFSLDRKDIDAHTGALITENWSPRSMIDLAETSTILRTLFEFIGPRRHPKLLNEKFDFLAEVAKAAEKYNVYSAMNTCSERMRSFGDRHPRLVLLYAAYNDYPHIFNECAPLVITSENLEDLTPLLPSEFHLPWLRYHAKWSKALTDIATYSSIPSSAWSSSKCWRSCGRIIYHALAAGVHSLSDLSLIFADNVRNHTSSCKDCEEVCSNWKRHAETVIGEIGPFSETCMAAEPLVKVE